MSRLTVTERKAIEDRLASGMTLDEACHDLARLEYMTRLHYENLSPEEKERILQEQENPLYQWLEYNR